MSQQKGSAAPWIIAGIVILIILILFFLFQYKAPSPATGNGNTPTSGFTPLNSSSNPFVTAAPTNETLPPQTVAPAAVPAQTVTNVPTQTYAVPPTETPAPQQTYQIQTSAPAPIISTPFVTNVVQAGSPNYAPSVSPSYTYTIPTIAYTPPTYPTQSTTTRGQGSSGSSGGVSLDETIFGYVSGLGWTQLLGSVGQDVFNALYATTPGGTTGATIGRFLPGGSSVFGSGGGGGGGGIGGFGGGGGGGGGGSVLNFGTMKITRITECTCSGSRMLQMQDVNGQSLSLTVTPGTQVKLAATSMYGIHVGMSALGNYTSGGSCLIVHGEECDSSQGTPQGEITVMGTSQ